MDAVRLQQRAVKVFADYCQFYIWDGGMAPQAPEEYGPEDVRRRMKTGPHVVVVQTASNVTVAVEVEVHDAEPATNISDWDHVVEASLHLPTGQLQVHESTGGPVADFLVEPGWYRVRACHAGLSTPDESGAAGRDRYLALVWPAAADEMRVVKQWAAGVE